LFSSSSAQEVRREGVTPKKKNQDFAGVAFLCVYGMVGLYLLLKDSILDDADENNQSV
jgi:hypothetical protein